MSNSISRYSSSRFSDIFIPLAVLIYLTLVACNNNLITTGTPEANQTQQINPVGESTLIVESTLTSSPNLDFPLSLGTTWVYSATHYDTFVPNERITATYQITETIAEVQLLDGHYAAQLIRDNSILRSSVDISDSRYDNFLLQRTWTPSYWYVISGTLLYLQHELDGEALKSAGPRYIFPLEDKSSWHHIPELPGVTTYAASVGSLTVPAGSFEECFQITTVFTSGPRLQWFCNGIGVVREKYDHVGTPFGYEQILLNFWDGD